MTEFSTVAFHDATLEQVSVDWATGSCVAWFRRSVSGNHRTRVIWGGLTEFTLERNQPWGPSESVLEVRSHADALDELVMQSGDVIRVRATTRYVEDAAEGVGARYAAVIADALVDAAVLAPEHVRQAATIAAREIDVRRSLGDL